MKETILAILPNQASADSAIVALESKGYKADDFSVITRNTITDGKVASAGDKMASGAVSGATTGGTIGALAGLLVGIGAITIPGLGAILIGGQLAAALGLTGAVAATATGALTGALAGGLVGALVSLGIPENTAKIYEKRIGEGGILLAVTTNHGLDADAHAILEDNDAEDITTVTA
jgi:hypothetical protein